MSIDAARLERAYQTALAALLAERNPEGHWVGELSASALSTATAVAALSLVQKNTPPADRFAHLIAGGLTWLAEHQNTDGGWGDTVKSFSNISTTMLCRAAFHLADSAAGDVAAFARTRGGDHHQGPSLPAFRRTRLQTPELAAKFADCLKRADDWLGERYGKTAEEQSEAVRARYGKDRTFAVPILTTCALAGLVSWKEVPALPFELACLPQSWFRFLRLQVVSYALPALIAIGQAVHHHRPSWNPIVRLIRWLARGRSLKVLRAIQPSSGGYLEATPLTSFVTLSLASIGLADHSVAQSAVQFLETAVRPDGSWPIDSNLATWVTTLAINALATAGDLGILDKKPELVDWLFGQQIKEWHPYSGAAPGGWAWTPLPGGVPDADDSPGAILALNHLAPTMDTSNDMLLAMDWLCGLQNRDGGWPTFCKGWGHLPFDRSGPDLTAHAIRAIQHWRQPFLAIIGTDYDLAWEKYGLAEHFRLEPALSYLARQQRPDGSWLPLWFGNQHAPDDENPTYGTARVLAAYRDLDMINTEPAQRGIAWLLSIQNSDGGWGGAKNVPSSVEETALAVEVLLDAGSQSAEAVNRGLAWLIQQVEAGGLHDPTPIGFYFAKLWYFEKLYPIIFSVAALGRARKKLAV